VLLRNNEIVVNQVSYQHLQVMQSSAIIKLTIEEFLILILDQTSIFIAITDNITFLSPMSLFIARISSFKSVISWSETHYKTNIQIQLHISRNRKINQLNIEIFSKTVHIMQQNILASLKI